MSLVMGKAMVLSEVLVQCSTKVPEGDKAEWARSGKAVTWRMKILITVGLGTTARPLGLPPREGQRHLSCTKSPLREEE